jgi:hypothetical protein
VLTVDRDVVPQEKGGVVDPRNFKVVSRISSSILTRRLKRTRLCFLVRNTVSLSRCIWPLWLQTDAKMIGTCMWSMLLRFPCFPGSILRYAQCLYSALKSFTECGLVSRWYMQLPSLLLNASRTELRSLSSLSQTQVVYSYGGEFLISCTRLLQFKLCIYASV